MTDDEFQEVMHLIEEQLQAAGLPEIAAVQNYYWEEGQKPGPREIAIRMLKAFDTHLSTLDPATYRESMNKIKTSLRRPGLEDTPPKRSARRLSGPKGAVVDIAQETAAQMNAPNRIDLSRLRNLSRLRKSLNKLIRELYETPLDEPPARPPS